MHRVLRGIGKSAVAGNASLLLLILARRGEERGQHAFLASTMLSRVFSSLFFSFFLSFSLCPSFLSGSHDLYAGGEKEKGDASRGGRRTTPRNVNLKRRNRKKAATTAASVSTSTVAARTGVVHAPVRPSCRLRVPLSSATRHNHDGDAVRTGGREASAATFPTTTHEIITIIIIITITGNTGAARTRRRGSVSKTRPGSTPEALSV